MYVSKRLALRQGLYSLSDALRLSGTNKLTLLHVRDSNPSKDANIRAFATTQTIQTVSNKGKMTFYITSFKNHYVDGRGCQCLLFLLPLFH